MKFVKILLVVTVVLTVFVGCKNDDEVVTEFDSSGLILGQDQALCACCGNWIIKIDGEQNPYQFLELPDNSDIDLNNVTFPLSVSLNWTESPTGCRYAIISDIEIN